MELILNEIRQSFKDNIDDSVLNSEKKFFKEEIKIYGLKIPVVNKIGKEFYGKIKNNPKVEIYNLCEDLWKSGYMEEGFIACNWSYYLKDKYEPADFEVFERWVNEYVSNWATCDTLCNHTVGTFMEMYPDYINRLKEWATSSNRWVKRAAAVTLIIPARKGMFLKDIFEIADILLSDKDDLVQKGYGWMLKAASEAYREEVFNYVLSKKNSMPRTSLRYAIEKMPPEMRVEAMKKN